MPTGVYKTTKKDGSVYYRVSITFKNKHISLGSNNDETQAYAMYKLAQDIISSPDTHWVNADSLHTSYKNSFSLNYSKYITLINFRDNDIYIKTPIYLCKSFFLYFIDENTALKFSTDDLFYYSNHTIMSRGGYYFVNDYGMQTSILSRYGIRNHSVKGRDYIFRNNDTHDYRYENVLVINRYNGVSQLEKKGRIQYQSRIHINGDYILGTYQTENEAAIAYNKAADMLSEVSTVSYTRNYIEGISRVEYASLYHNVKLSKKFREYIKLQQSFQQ